MITKMISRTSLAINNKRCQRTVKHFMKILNNTNQYLKIVLKNFQISIITFTGVDLMENTTKIMLQTIEIAKWI